MGVRRSVLGLLVAGLVLTGCGRDTGPADEVPELAARLDRVDAAVADGDHAAARTALRALAATTDRAEAAGDLTADEATRIDDAVTALLDDLADETPTEEPSPSDDTTPSDPETSESTAPEETVSPSEPANEPKPPKDEKEKGKHKGKGH